MDLSPAETVIVGILRGEVHTDFALNVVRSDDTVLVTISSETDGVRIGDGQTFEEAFHSLCGRAGPTPPPIGGEPAPRPALRIVGGSGHHPDAVEAA